MSTWKQVMIVSVFYDHTATYDQLTLEEVAVPKQDTRDIRGL